MNSLSKPLRQTAAPAVQDLWIRAKDGFELAATVYKPAGSVKAAAVIPSAFGVPRRFYRHFGRAAAAEGYLAVTFDYRGMWDSRPDSLRGFAADLLDWAEKDVDAIIRWAADRADGAPVFVIGHSIGVHMTAIAPANNLLNGVVSIASGSGYWRHRPLAKSWFLGLTWRLLVPVLARLFGFYPARALGFVADIPKGVVLRWAKWNLHPDYMLDREGSSYASRGGFLQFTAPVLSISFTDDEVMLQPNIEALNGLFTGSVLETRRFSPADFQLEKIGHFNFFRDTCAAVWPEVFDWLGQITK